MNKKLPYEDAFEQQMNQLPLPDEDASWQKMNTLLNDKSKRRPLVFFTLYKGGSILFILLLFGLPLTMPFLHKGIEMPGFSSVNKGFAPEKSIPDGNPEELRAAPAPSPYSTSPFIRKRENQHDRSSQFPVHPATAALTSTQKNPVSEKRKIISAGYTKASKKNVVEQTYLRGSQKYKATKADDFTANILVTTARNDSAGFTAMTQGLQNKQLVADTASGLPDEQKQPVKPVHDSLVQKNEPHADDAPIKISPGSGSKYFVSAGIGVQQQVPVAGQKSVWYGYNGDKGILSDYLPSLYLRFEKDRKWFLQAEFSYITPQLVKDFSYSRQTRADSSSTNVTVTNLHLKKTFYSQVPVSFNYYIRSHWSAGVGATYSWFHGAITERETVKQNVQSQAASTTSQIVPVANYTDSFLYRSHTFILVQTNYQWRKFSVGVRYTKDIQPYIKYTLPDGTVTDRKNWSFEAILHVGLWKSAKF